ncbi:MAG TPA: hypothetical protein VJ023_07335 [Pyrinomonadaceae bacterium]|nr:hypothetical protein [Pyrinomonadaceae bacterium]
MLKQSGGLAGDGVYVSVESIIDAAWMGARVGMGPITLITAVSPMRS